MIRTRPDGEVVLAVGVALVVLSASPIYTLNGDSSGGSFRGSPLLVLPLAVAIGLLHLHHARIALGRTPRRFAALTVLVQAVLVYAPMLLWHYNWASTQAFVLASIALLYRARITAIAALAVGVGMSIALWNSHVTTIGMQLVFLTYWAVGLTVGAVSLVASVRLIGVLRDLKATRAAAAEAAVDHERLRVARDVHDLLGQSLSAVSLKGDLALALLRRDPPTARAEIASLTEVARGALRGIRAISRDEHEISLRTEFDGATALLRAAGVQLDVRTSIDPDQTSGPGADLVAWALREGVTNVLRHSDARLCSITLDRHDGALIMHMENDEARGRDGGGTGLDGLRTRARPLGGVVDVTQTPERFCLTVTVPEQAMAARPA